MSDRFVKKPEVKEPNDFLIHQKKDKIIRIPTGVCFIVKVLKDKIVVNKFF